MIEEFVSRMFATRDAAHKAHLSAKGAGSYASHEALGAFYTCLISKTDMIVEVYQGMFGLIGPVKTKAANGNILSIIKNDIDWLVMNKEEIAGEFCAVENLIDELLALYASTKYKLENLK